MITDIFNTNKHTRSLSYTDSFTWAGNFLFSSIVAIHLGARLGIDAVSAIAVGFSIHLLVRALAQIPISKALDSNKSHKDELYSMLLGCILMSISFVCFEFVRSAVDLYVINALSGLGSAFYLPAWRKNFAYYAEKGSEGLNYAYSDILFAISGAVAAALGGYVVQITGTFTHVFIASGVITLIGGFTSLRLAKVTK